jgi:hypothetical protein
MKRLVNSLLPLFVFALSFCLVPLRLYDGLSLMPGNVGDARLNNYFLENIFQFISGRVPSLWHLTFFYPFPWVLGFSDNLLGSAPVYLVARAAGAASDTAFQIWFLVGYGVNFAAAYYALRRLGGSVLAASLGAVIFAFALPTSAHADHAQLHYRFGIPIALVFFAEFLHQKSLRKLMAACVWLVWQFYVGIYMGFFALVFMVLMLLSHVFSSSSRPLLSGLRAQVSAPARYLMSLPRRDRIGVLVCLVVLLAVLVLLFIPYLKVKAVYGTTRPWWEISSMLPRPQSYFLSDGSWIWSSPSNALFTALPMRHEHQMFVGLVPLLLAVAGVVAGLRSGMPYAVKLMVSAMGLMILITLNIGGASLWMLFHGLPLASAIRAMTRFDQVLLFPIGVLAMIALDALRRRINAGPALAVSVVIFAAGIAEMALHGSNSSAKAEWRLRIAVAEARVPKDLPKDAILFTSQRNGPIDAGEVDAMWVALRRGVPTMNGYSGSMPPGASWQFGTDCSEVVRRLRSYQSLLHAPNREEQYRALMSRVVLVGFDSCDQKQLTERPPISIADRPYSAEEVTHLSYAIARMDPKVGEAVVTIRNTADFPFAVWSDIGRPLRMSWRYLDGLGKPMSGWESRKDLSQDIPAQSEIQVVLPLQIPTGAASLEVTMVQELTFWLHDQGIPTASAPLP